MTHGLTSVFAICTSRRKELRVHEELLVTIWLFLHSNLEIISHTIIVCDILGEISRLCQTCYWKTPCGPYLVRDHLPYLSEHLILAFWVGS